MIGMIVATDPNGLIGKNNEIPWFYKGDLKLFKKKTSGHVVIMGRKTWESLPDKMKPLPNRVNIVVTSRPDEIIPKVEKTTLVTAPSLEVAIEFGRDLKGKDIWLMGGRGIYEEGLQYADFILETRVPEAVEVSDEDDLVYFPEVGEGWYTAKTHKHPHSEVCSLRMWVKSSTNPADTKGDEDE